MVRLKNPMADLATAGPPLPRPAVDTHRELLERLDARLREEVRASLEGLRGRVLVVGAQWPELALDLAREGRFVTLLDPRPELLAPVREQVIEERLTQRVTIDPRSYADVDFEATSFEAVVLYDPFAYLTAPRALFNKVRREMRAGGELVLRVALKAGAAYPDTPLQKGLTAEAADIPSTDARTKKVLGVRDRALAGIYGALGAARLLGVEARARVKSGDLGRPARRGPDWDTLYEALSDSFVVTRVRPLHLASWEVAELAATLRGPLAGVAAKLLDPALKLDERLLARPELRPFASTALVHATKQRELGRVFVLPRGRG